MRTRKYLVAAFTFAAFLTMSGQSFAGNQRYYSSPNGSNSPVLTYTGSDTSYSTRNTQSNDVAQYGRAERQQESVSYGSRFQQERCAMLKNSKTSQLAGCN